MAEKKTTKKKRSTKKAAATKPPKIHRKISDWWRGARAYAGLAEMEAKGEEIFTSPEVANDRANICSQCPLNREAGIQERVADALIKLRVRKQKTPFDDKLKNCQVCTCPVKLMVHLSDEALLKTKGRSETEKGLTLARANVKQDPNPDCWMLRLLQLKHFS